MTTNELMAAAVEQLKVKAAAEKQLGFMGALKVPYGASFDGVICEATQCLCQNGKDHWQYRFYLLPAGQRYRKAFSKAKAIERLG
jgi:hypothetical protein